MAIVLSDMLKSETKALHDNVENNPFMMKIDQKCFHKEDYIALLKLFYGLHHMAEAQLFQFEELEMGLRERSSKLEEDLFRLGCDGGDLKKSCESDLELKIDTLSKAYGALYVLEGSRMGGVYLSKLIKKALGDEIPLAYFEGVKEMTPAYVELFKTQLNEKAVLLDIQECIQCAKDTFVLTNYLFMRNKDA